MFTRGEQMSKTALHSLKELNEAPSWLTDEGYQMLAKGYLLHGETPRGAWRRVTSKAAEYSGLERSERIFSYLWNGWLGLASPVLSNYNTTRGLPISCYSLHVPDSVSGIADSIKEMMLLSKHGGGVGSYWGDVRGRGTPIQGGANGKSEGVVPWLHIQDSATIATAQGGVRKGASASYLPVGHKDIHEFIGMRRPSGDTNRQNLNIHHGVCIDDDFMKSLTNDSHKDCFENRKKWQAILSARLETGEPYLFFSDNVNNARPECYVKNNLMISTSNICSEILLHTNDKSTFVCCLSSVNLDRYDEWKGNGTFIEDCIWFLDGIIEDFIEKTENLEGFERARNFAISSRALGLGVMGWHSLLQSKSLPFDSFQAMMLNSEIFKFIQEYSDKASQKLAAEKGEPEWCKGFGVRNSHRIALAPTASNSVISGNVSPGIEPVVANAFMQKTAKGTFIKQNEKLRPILSSYERNTEEVWKDIAMNNGSVQHLKFLSEHEKSVFLTAYEINQMSLIRQAAQRQKYIDQSQSLNLFFPADVDPNYFHRVHYEAWKMGVKTLYYTRTTSILSGSQAGKDLSKECKACEG
jgi:ribonucleoside-diphosphate reductase alpha chain